MNYNAPQAVKAILEARAGSYGDEVDVLDHILFDSLTFQATTVRAQSIFFSVPNNGGTKTQQETNMTLQGQLPSKQWMVVDAWSVAAIGGVVGADVDSNTVVSALTNIIQYSLFSLVLSGRAFDSQAPGSAFLPNIFVNALDSAANGRRVGDFNAQAWMPLNIPVVIEPSANFSVTQQTGSSIAAVNTILNTASDVLATQNAQLQVRLKGTLIRAK